MPKLSPMYLECKYSVFRSVLNQRFYIERFFLARLFAEHHYLFCQVHKREPIAPAFMPLKYSVGNSNAVCDHCAAKQIASDPWCVAPDDNLRLDRTRELIVLGSAIEILLGIDSHACHFRVHTKSVLIFPSLFPAPTATPLQIRTNAFSTIR